MMPMFSWDGKNKKFLIGPSAGIVLIGIVFAFKGIDVPTWFLQIIARWWK